MVIGPDGHTYFTTRETAHLFAVHERAIRRWADMEDVKCLQNKPPDKRRGHLYFRGLDLLHLMDSGIRNPRKGARAGLINMLRVGECPAEILYARGVGMS